MLGMVTGFMFSPDLKNVAVIQKNRPAWQAGKFNGVGGKVESNEIPIDAMVREFWEETGVATSTLDWQLRIIMRRGDGPKAFCLNIYSCVSPQVFDVATVTDEKVEIMPVAELLNHPVIPNMRWVLPLVMDNDVRCTVVEYKY